MSSVETYRAKVEELIRQADISTVSARGIRKQIETLTNSSLANVKSEFDKMVMEIYDKITEDIDLEAANGAQQQQPAKPSPQPQLQANSFGGFALPPTSYVAPKPAPPKPAPSKPAPLKRKQAPKDESDEDSGSDSDSSFSSVEESSGRAKKKAKTTSSTKSSKKSSKSPSRSSSKSSSSTKKSKDKDKDKAKTKRKQPTNDDGTPKVNNFTRPMVISDKLNDVVGHAGAIGPSGRMEMSRPEVVKQMWVYIKTNNLQDEKDKRKINCDAKLKALFGQDEVTSFSMNKYLSSHLSKPEELL
ncbi:hypothetical protein BGX34_002102 [Mortierella sp. NVP85]|nr:hypothetical protein BGX34_002102 [Mortierella sp. NVP85]